MTFPARETRWEPCAPAQTDIWLAERLGEMGSSYHLAFGFAIDGVLDRDALESACRCLLRRHPVLLTCYPDRDGEPVRAPVPESAWRLEQLSASGVTDRAVRDWVGARFDLARGPLVRTALVPTGADRHLLLFTCHHLVFDGVSRDIVAADLAILYRAAARGADPGWPPLPPYRRYVRWQRGHLRRSPAGWHDNAALIADPARLSASFRLAGGSPGDGGADLALPPGLRSRLAALAQDAGVSLFTALLASFGVLLGRYHHGSGESAPVITIPCDSRPPAHAHCAGLFVNELPFRSPPAAGASFRDHLSATGRRLRELLALRAVPLAEQVRSGGPAVIFGYRRTASPPPAWPGLDVRFVRWLPHHNTRAEVEVQLFDDGSQVIGRLSGDAARLGGGAARQLTTHWLAAMNRLASTPDSPLAHLDVLTPRERHGIVVDWNRTEAPRRNDTLAELFEAQVAATPEAVALVAGDASTRVEVGYAELNRRANRLAHRLRALGAGPETLVAVCLERSPRLLEALLGTLKAGAAYLPLDPEHPPARRTSLLRDCGARILVTELALSADGPATLLVDEPAALAGEPDTNPEPAARPGHPAYAIYTSGSTGTPKAALITHRAVGNRLAWMQERYRLDAGDRVLQKTSVGFDVSVWELFWPLLTGARLVLARPGGQRDVPYLIDLINREGVTTVHFVPPMLDAFLDHPGSATCHSVRRVISSGEDLPGWLVRRFYTRFGAAELHNLYGPTEATIDVTGWYCPRDLATDRVPIGRPIANTRLHILDRDLRPVPVGVAGELYIGGLALARGYAGRPALTADRFVPDALSGSGERLYRSGDLARYRADGAIEFLGRLDHQLKIRGNRVEPAEIEAVLAGDPLVRHAVVISRDRPGGAELVAYVVAADPAAPPRSPQLLARIREHLPGYMVPAAVVVLNALPLTPNGKLDRRGLPDPPPAAARADQEPGSATERLVAQVWSEVFGVPRVGVDDDFFELGGHSLLATRTVARLREAAGVDLSMRVVFECSTVRTLAAAVEEANRR
jgi:amino acid adenylation domain-containing protein